MADLSACHRGAAAVIGGAGHMILNVLWEWALQQHIPPAALSRVSAYDWFGSLAIQPIGLIIIGPIATGIGTATSLYLGATLEVLVLASLLLVRDIRAIGPSEPRITLASRAPEVVTKRA